MDPRFLRTFETVTRLASFSAAARELGYTQSAISQQIAALEAGLGTPLLYRRPVAPTEAGARLLEHAEPILLRLAAARADVAKVAAGPPQVPRNGISSSRAVRIAATTFSGSSYGLPGATHMPSKAPRPSASVVGIQYGSRTRPSRRRSASIRSGMRPWARTLGERSPITASFAVVMAACSRSRPIASNDLLWQSDQRS